MGTQPTAQQRPKPFHGMHMHFTQPVAIFLAGEFAPFMVDGLMVVAPRLKTGIHAVLICVHQGALRNCVFHERLDRLLLHIGQQMDHDLTPTLHHPKNGWSFFLHRTSSTFPFASASTTLAAFVLHHLWLSLMASNHIGFVTIHLVGEHHCRFFFTIPPRSSVVI